MLLRLHLLTRARRLPPVLAVLLTGVLLLSLAGPAAPAQAAPLPDDDTSGPGFIFFQRFRGEICAYTQAAAHFELVAEGGGIVPGADAKITAARGTASVEFNWATGEGVASYKAPGKPGPETVTITAGNMWGRATKTFKIDIIECDYRVSINATSFDSNEGASMYQTLTGQGNFKMNDGKAIGKGRAKYTMDLWGGVIGFGCQLTPTIDVDAPFTIKDPGSPLAPLGDQILLAFDISPFNIPETKIQCNYTLGGDITVSPIPLPGGPSNMSEYFNFMVFSSQGGEYEFKFHKGTGYVNVIPLLKE